MKKKTKCAPARRKARNNSTKSDITIRLKAIDGYSATRKFKTLEGARKFAREMLGQHYDIGSGYAVSGSGTLTLRAEGATLEELLVPDAPPASTACECDALLNEDTGQWSGPCDFCRSPAGKAANARAKAKHEHDEQLFKQVRAYAKKLGNDRFGDGLRTNIRRGEYYNLRWLDIPKHDRDLIEAKAEKLGVSTEYRTGELVTSYDFETAF